MMPPYTQVTQYDVELYQKIERLISKKLEAYPAGAYTRERFSST
jgi:hypothetical protein